MSDYIHKFNSFITNQIKNIKDISIIEFGVKEGRSTEIFLSLCKKNSGKLYSIDVVDYGSKFDDPNWTFIHSRDDNFKYLDLKLPNNVDVIYLDSLHEAKHVKKIIYHYYKRLKIGGFFFIDDISWLPYQKNQPRNNFYCEINNYETFKQILEIYNTNQSNFDLSFDFTSSGLCKILKKKDTLNLPFKIFLRNVSIKNFFRKILQLISLK